MYGYLISVGIRVPFHHVHEAQAHIDPEGSFLRRLRFLNRRWYCVPGPQWLWYIDGNHKLIRLCSLIIFSNKLFSGVLYRWKMVIHGAIDGYSRIIMYLHCSNSNTAETVLGLH